jgi:hypothetical protein
LPPCDYRQRRESFLVFIGRIAAGVIVYLLVLCGFCEIKRLVGENYILSVKQA